MLSYRISPEQWDTDAQFERVLQLLAAHRRGADEVALFEQHYPRPAADVPLSQLTAAWARRIAQLKQLGYRAGINVLWTLGHQDMPGLPAPKNHSQLMVGHDGAVSNACFCPNDPAFHTRIQERYRAAAQAKPDFIWVDDDFRMSHHGVTYPCFCPLCLAKFGHGTDRARLVAELNEPANTPLRRAWSEFCAASLESVARDIGQAIRETDPDVEIGLMTIGYSHSTYAGYAFPRWMRALGAKRGRPGHGYYTDDAPRQLASKTLDVGREIRDYPSTVRSIEYELENYPYIELDKAAQTVLNESTLALMMGCTGVAYNALKECVGTLRDYEPLLAAIAAERPVWESLRQVMDGLPLAGLWPADSPSLMAERTVGPNGWFSEGPLYNIQQPNQLADIGIALTPDRRSSCGVILAGKVAEAFSADELRTMLQGAVLADGVALQVLWERGVGELTGVRPGEHYGSSVTEHFTDHQFNCADRGDGRDALVGPGDNVCSLAPAAPGVESLSRLMRYDGVDCGSCLSVFTNKLGGRVAVTSYAPWRCLGRGAKRRQLTALADWLSHGRLPVLIEQNARVAPFVRVAADGRRATLVLFNMALDPSGPLTVRLRAHPDKVRLLTAAGPVELSSHAVGGETRIEVPSIPAWHTAVLAGA